MLYNKRVYVCAILIENMSVFVRESGRREEKRVIVVHVIAL